MLAPIVLQARWYKVNIIKSVVVSIPLTTIGTIGTLLLFYIESDGRIGGTSFYGAVFFVPVAFLPLSSLLRIKYSELMDLCAPAECAMLVVMKMRCLLSGCCEGRVLYTNDIGTQVRFPSQIVEMVIAILLCVVLLIIAHNKKSHGSIYPWYMILYGATRFILNIFREEWVASDMILPYGNIWSLVSLAIGIISLIIINKKKKTETQVV